MSGRIGSRQCVTHQHTCVLGKLGGFTAHDPLTAALGCGPIRGRSGRWCFGLPHFCSGRGQTSSWVEGFVPPSRTELSLGARPPPREVEDFEPGWRWGWQHEAASRVERQHREDDILPKLDESASILLRSQSGPAAAAALSATSFEPYPLASTLRCSTVASLALASASCLTHLPHARLLVCSRAGVLGARVCSGECGRTDFP